MNSHHLFRRHEMDNRAARAIQRDPYLRRVTEPDFPQPSIPGCSNFPDCGCGVECYQKGSLSPIDPFPWPRDGNSAKWWIYLVVVVGSAFGFIGLMIGVYLVGLAM